jgi:hypothetical protein
MLDVDDQYLEHVERVIVSGRRVLELFVDWVHI